MRIAQGLRCHPVLAVAAVQITAEHSKAVRQRTGVHMKERFLFDRVALNAADVTPRHAQTSALVEPNFADTQRAVWDRALMTAGMTPQTATRQRLDKLGSRLLGADRQHVL